MLSFVFAALIVLLDQIIKRWIVLVLPLSGEIPLIPGVICLTRIENTGAAFSILEDQRWLLAGIAFVAVIALIFILLRYDEGFWGMLGLASILGGAVGNLIDRVIHGHVVDMFKPLFIQFAIFNIADIFIVLGGLTFCTFFIISLFKGANNTRGQSLEGYDGDQYDPDDYVDERVDNNYDALTGKGAPSRRRSAASIAEHSRQSPKTDSELEDYYGAMLGDSDYDDTASGSDDFDDSEEESGSFEEYGGGRASVYEPTARRDDPFDADISATLDILGDFELDLDSVEEYDVDAILREYGFEDDSSN